MGESIPISGKGVKLVKSPQRFLIKLTFSKDYNIQSCQRAQDCCCSYCRFSTHHGIVTDERTDGFAIAIDDTKRQGGESFRMRTHLGMGESTMGRYVHRANRLGGESTIG